MEFFYQSGAMGFYGEGWGWHELFDYSFPKFPVISKTISYSAVKGSNYKVIPIPFFKSVWNKVGLKNPGIVYWLGKCYPEMDVANVYLSLYIDGYDSLLLICRALQNVPLKGIELNVSCPNIKPKTNSRYVPISRCIDVLRNKLMVDEFFLKVGHTQNLYNIDSLHRVDRINVNSVPIKKGAISGKLAQKKNWGFIKRWQGKPGIPPISGCSWYSIDDLKYLEDIGCYYMGIGSVILTNPKLVEGLKDYGRN